MSIEFPEAKLLRELLCPPHASLDENRHLEAFDNCIACIRVERDELRQLLLRISTDIGQTIIEDPIKSAEGWTLLSKPVLADIAAVFESPMSSPKPVTRFDEFDDADHPFRKWWEKHGQFMLSGGGRRESIWAARGWIAREQLLCGKEVTGDSMHEDREVAPVSPEPPRDMSSVISSLPPGGIPAAPAADVLASQSGGGKWSKMMAEVLPCGHTNAQHFYVESGDLKLENCSLLREAEPVSAKPDLATILCGAAQILDVVKGEWGESWSTWDQSIRNGISTLLAEAYSAQSLSAHTEHGCKECRDLHNTICGCRCHSGESASPRMLEGFKCKARSSNMGANDPQECDWPVCGCDPYADKVIAALQEHGILASPRMPEGQMERTEGPEKERA